MKGNVVQLLWITNESPVDLSHTRDQAAQKTGVPPPRNGSICRVVDFAPITGDLKGIDHHEVLRQMGIDPATQGYVRHPFTHRTRSIDYAIVLEGDEVVHRRGAGDLERAEPHEHDPERDAQQRQADAVQELEDAGVAASLVTVMPVPGAFELPLGAMAQAKTRKYSCIVALGCVVRGETPHFDYVAGEAASGLQLAALETGVPVAFGVLTVESVAQAEARIDRARDAVRSALEMAEAVLGCLTGIAAGEKVKVMASEGLVLLVEPLHEGEGAEGAAEPAPTD